MKKKLFPLLAAILLLCASCTPTAGPNAAEEPPLTEEELAAPAPEFLDEELQALYRRMCSVYGNLFGGALEYFDDAWPLAEGQARAEVLEGPTDTTGGRYEVATGRYAAWADFDAMVHSLMTDRLFQEENETPTLFQEYQGRTAYLPTGKSLGGNRNPFFPDTFELIEQTEECIRFYVVGYYSDDAGIRDNETQEEWAQRLQAGYDESKQFEIVLLHTEDGWRFDQFARTEE